MENTKIYYKITPRYVVLYNVFHLGKTLACLSIYIDKHKKNVTKKHLSRIKEIDEGKFYNRIRPFNMLHDGADVIAKLLLENKLDGFLGKDSFN